MSTDLQQIRSDIQSRLWFTYRKGFVQIGNTNFTSDRGWGCMLRCGQMVIGQALIFLHLGKLSRLFKIMSTNIHNINMYGVN